MPKLLVLFQSSTADVVHLTETAAEGARGVRFSEVDVRRLPPAGGTRDAEPDATGRGHRLLEDADALGQYDGLIFVVGQEEDGEAMQHALDAFGGSLVNKVGAAVTPTRGADRRGVLWSVLGAMANRELILVPARFDDEGASDDATRRIGKRIAEVVGWVTHARSHHH
jgi:hypothetical protein